MGQPDPGQLVRTQDSIRCKLLAFLCHFAEIDICAPTLDDEDLLNQMLVFLRKSKGIHFQGKVENE